MGLPPGTDIPFASLGQGEYNANFRFRHPATGQDLVLRVNTGSQMHLPDQIAYEFFALTDLLPTGRTPRPLFYDDSRAILPYGALVMTWLPGRHLRYEEDMGAAAAILADIHALPVPENTRLLRPDRPAGEHLSGVPGHGGALPRLGGGGQDRPPSAGDPDPGGGPPASGGNPPPLRRPSSARS